MHATVCDVMTWTSLTIRPECSALSALETLVAAEAEELFIVDGDDRFLGILTDFELLKADLNGSLANTSAGALMQRRPMMLAPEQPIADAAKLFRDGGLSCVPVIRDGRLLGMLQRRDVLRWLSTQRAMVLETPIPAPKYLQAPQRAAVC
jgi:CBS domain-containing protein